MRSASVYVAIAGLSVVVALVWPLSPALPPSDAVSARVFACIGAGIICLGMAASRANLWGGPRVWIGAALVSGVLGVILLALHHDASSACVSTYQSQPKIIGRELQPYVQLGHGDTPANLLLDGIGVPENVWTPASIRTCRWLLGWVATASIQLFALCACCLVQQARRRILAPASARPPLVPHAGPCKYDVFFSYRHIEPDRSFAFQLLEQLEERGVRAAIDEREFRPNHHFLTEMERCILESRYVLCIVTSRYVASDHCVEEAVISKTIDMAERTRRVVPLIFERVQLPVWLHGIVGIDFTELSTVDPLEKLVSLVRERAEISRT